MILFHDYESYYDSKTYTLKKLTPPEYILDKRFQCHGCAFKNGVSGAPFWLDHHEIKYLYKQLDPAKTVMVSYNALFDSCITAWRYDFVPALMVDALGMSRALRGHLFASHSLANVAKALGLPAKAHALIKVDGMRTEEIKANPVLWKEFTDYALTDVALCASIYEELRPEMPLSEFRVMDLVLRCAVQPQFRLNRKTLVMHRRSIRTKKFEMMRNAKVERVDLMSSAKFTDLITSKGVVVQFKTSPTGKSIPALAKTDDFMTELLEHPDPDVQALAAARLGMKSTLEETRAKRFAALARLPSSYHYPGGSAPIALRYGAALTHRLGGEWKLNFQNLTRGSPLRHAIEAWDDDVILAPDYSQIEARMVAFIAKAQNLLEMFEQKQDPYNALASVIFGRPINRKLPRDKIEGFIGKTGILGLGYGAGTDKFHMMVHQLARVQLGYDIPFTEQQAKDAVQAYRYKMFPDIPKCWRIFDTVIQEIIGQPRIAAWKQIFPFLEIQHEQIILPNDMSLRYKDLRILGTAGITYQYGRETRPIYGAKVLENVSQALSRIIAMNAATRLADRGVRMGLQAHDELVFRCRKDEVEATTALIYQEMTRRPSWGLNIPLAIEVKAGKSYGDAK